MASLLRSPEVDSSSLEHDQIGLTLCLMLLALIRCIKGIIDQQLHFNIWMYFYVLAMLVNIIQ